MHVEGEALGASYRITNFALPDLRSAAPNGLSYSVCTLGILNGKVSVSIRGTTLSP